MTTQVAQQPTTQHVFSKITRVPDLLADQHPIVSLYVDGDQVLHMQCRLEASGFIVLFPVTFRLINRYLSGDYSLAEVVEQAPCEELYVVTRGHNLLELPKDGFDATQLSFAGDYYPEIRLCKTNSIASIRQGLHDCMRA